MISVKAEGVDRLLKGLSLSAKELQRVEVRAVNKTAQGVRTDIVSGIRKDVGLNVKAKDVRPLIRIRKANYNRPVADVAVQGGGSLPLYAFSPRPSRPGGRKPKSGTSVLVRKDRGRKSVAHSFIARLGNHLGVYQRKGKERFPIKELFGPSIMSYLKQGSAFLAKIMRQADERLRKNMKHETNYALRRIK